VVKSRRTEARSGDLCGEGEEVVLGGGELVVGAAGVVVAEGDVDGDAREGGAQARDLVADGLFDEGEIAGVGGGGDEALVFAVELVGEEIAADGDEFCVRGIRVDGLEARLPEDVGGVDAADGAGFLQCGGILRLGGGGWGGEDGLPVGGRGGVELGYFGGVGVWVQVDVGEEEGGEGGGGFGRGGLGCERNGDCEEECGAESLCHVLPVAANLWVVRGGINPTSGDEAA
jgi:hypothetical protein